jgi:hypothetical protein
MQTPQLNCDEISLEELHSLIADRQPSPFLPYLSPITSARVARDRAGREWEKFLGPQPLSRPDFVAVALRKFERRLEQRYAQAVAGAGRVC